MYGTMIEIPRAALTADEIAETAEFFSFGTNDLTQMTFGFSRDDIGGFVPDYLDKKILPADPFQVLDREGVGAADRDRHRARPRDPAAAQGRHLRRARRRADLGGVLPPRGHGLRDLLPLPRADRPPRGRPGGARRALRKRRTRR